MLALFIGGHSASRNVQWGQTTAATADGATPPDGFDAVQLGATLWAICHGAVEFEAGQVAASMIDWAEILRSGVSAMVDRFC